MSRVVASGLLLLTALLVQVVLLARLPGLPADLLVVVVVAVGLAAGPVPGAAHGFAAGLLADLVGDHPLGRLALAYAVAGHLGGLLRDPSSRSPLRVVPVAVAGAATAVVLYALQGLVTGDPRVTGRAFAASLGGAVAYAALLAPLVFPVVRALEARLSRDL